MITKIFYFSATGNSLSVARKIANQLNNVELISIPNALNQIDKIEADRVGFVIPVYAWGLPRIVEDLVKKIKLSENQYTFAIATCAGTPANTLIKLQKLLKDNGGNLDAGFVVNEGSYTFLEEPFIIKFMIKIKGPELLPFKERSLEIITKIRNKEGHSLESSSTLANFIGGLLHKFVIGEFKKAAKDFWINKDCNSCRSCEKICPRRNIKIVNNKPVWQENCEFCFACIQWCPQETIEYKEESIGKERSHNSAIKLDDIINC